MIQLNPFKLYKYFGEPVENYVKETSIWLMWQKYFEFAPILKKIKFQIKNPKILQMGYFTSHFSNELAEKFKAKQYLVIDKYKDNITQAELNNMDSSKVIYKRANPTSSEEESQMFDAVFIFDYLYRFGNWKSVIKEARRLLKPNGILVIKDKSVESFTVPGLGSLLRQVNQLPIEDMFDQVEFLTFLKKNGFVIEFDYDSLFSVEVIAKKIVL